MPFLFAAIYERIVAIPLLSVITYQQLFTLLGACDPAELAMPVQALYCETTHLVRDVHYEWTTGNEAFLVLECTSRAYAGRTLTYRNLLHDLQTFCRWQLNQEVVVGIGVELIEVLTVYHDFDFAADLKSTLMLVSTPPDEYFEAQAA